MKLVFFIIIFSFQLFANELKDIINACSEQSYAKSDLLCEELNFRLQSFEENGKVLIKELNLEQPVSFLSWISNPTFKYKFGTHKIIVDKNKTLYVYEF